MSEIKTSPFLLRKSTFTSQELCELNPSLFKKTKANEELKDQMEKTFDPLLQKGKYYKCYTILTKIYDQDGESMNFKSKFQIFRRILFSCMSLARKYFIKKDHKKYIEKMNFLFERVFFYLKEWFKYSQYYIAESGNPDLKIVKDIKENLLPLSMNERRLLFYQKPENYEENKQKECFQINFGYYLQEFISFFFEACHYLMLFEKIKNNKEFAAKLFDRINSFLDSDFLNSDISKIGVVSLQIKLSFASFYMELEEYQKAFDIYDGNLSLLRHMMASILDKKQEIPNKKLNRNNKRKKRIIYYFCLNLIFMGLIYEINNDFAKALDCYKFCLWIGLHFLNKNDGLLPFITNYARDAFNKYSRILAEKGEIEKIINLAFNRDANFFKEDAGKNQQNNTENTILKEMDEYFYKKFRYKELNSSKIIILSNRKYNEQMCSSILSTYTPKVGETKSTKVDFQTELIDLCNSNLTSPQLKKNESKFSTKKNTKIIQNNNYNPSLLSKASLDVSENNLKRKQSVLSSLKLYNERKTPSQRNNTQHLIEKKINVSNSKEKENNGNKIESLDEFFQNKIKRELSKKNENSSMEEVNEEFKFLKKIEGFDKSEINFNKKMLIHQKKFGIGKIKSEFLLDKLESDIAFVSPDKYVAKELHDIEIKTKAEKFVNKKKKAVLFGKTTLTPTIDPQKLNKPSSQIPSYPNPLTSPLNLKNTIEPAKTNRPSTARKNDVEMETRQHKEKIEIAGLMEAIEKNIENNRVNTEILLLKSNRKPIEHTRTRFLSSHNDLAISTTSYIRKEKPLMIDSMKQLITFKEKARDMRARHLSWKLNEKFKAFT